MNETLKNLMETMHPDQSILDRGLDYTKVPEDVYQDLRAASSARVRDRLVAEGRGAEPICFVLQHEVVFCTLCAREARGEKIDWSIFGDDEEDEDEEDNEEETDLPESYLYEDSCNYPTEEDDEDWDEDNNDIGFGG
jgi:hypothetical protein